MIGVSQLLNKNQLKNISVAEAQKSLAGLFEDDEKFRKAISLSTSDESNVKYRVSAIVNLFMK
jgi:hypothetical protein